MFCKLRLFKREKMWLPSNKGSPANKKGNNGNGVVALAIDKDKGSQYAIKWATENLVNRGQTLVLIHVVTKPTSSSYGNCGGVHVVDGNLSAHGQNLEKQTKELFLTFHCFCTRKDIRCLDVILEDSDVAKALTEYVSSAAIQNLVLGASRHGFIRRLKVTDIPSTVSKGAPDFCTVYVISKSKISSVKNASRPAPMASPLYKQIQQLEDQVNSGGCTPTARSKAIHAGSQRRSFITDESKIVGSGRPSTDHTSSMLYDGLDTGRMSQISSSSDSSFGSERLGARGSELSSFNDFSQSSFETDDGEGEMRRLKMELQRTMDLYSTACKEALTAKQKSVELNLWRVEEEKRLEEARLAEEAAKVAAEKERDKCRVAMETAEAAQRLAELEAKRRVDAEMQAHKEAEEKEKALMNIGQGDFRYRRYSIEEIEEATQYFSDSLKIGEGGYGPVYKCYLDHTPVAVKVLRPDAAQGRSQFQQEVEVLNRMRHPNMVLLLGACPEYGCLVYEYMAKGSLEERLMRRGDKPALSWQLRFRIAAEIATGLLFLHQTKPEPLVHRDLKPGNILLDHNFVTKISDVGLSRLIPASTAEEVTQYRMTSAAGTFCYIDPEYQQTGMLGVKSDVYSLGILLLQLITAKPPMGITHYVSRSIERGELKEALDPSVPDWPIEETFNFAKLAIQCAELRRKDRPDLGKVVLPELNHLKALAEENMGHLVVGGSACPSPSHSQASISQEMSSDPQGHSGFSTKSASTPSSSREKQSGSGDE
ncbi:U-box domain-containing protein 35-like isoform X2 [Lycium barbarum]|uniref:U-box domain-containing protein 35-like isoform X2 n=1 Tax=Lycium barbarum TaxID=112863 RepID=UPI00293F3E3C|nr:U-box domain-containing protein 35-like isoform X2 [Lycium barbarum]